MEYNENNVDQDGLTFKKIAGYGLIAIVVVFALLAFLGSITM